MAEVTEWHTAPNQKVVTVRKYELRKEHNTTERYTLMASVSLRNAVRRMNGNKSAGLTLWLALQDNKDGYTLNMSHKYFEQIYGMSKKVYDQGVKILLAEGFLVNRGGHNYDFVLYPSGHRNNTQTAQLKEPKRDSEKYPKETFKSAERGQVPNTPYTPMDNTTDNNNTYTERDNGGVGEEERENKSENTPTPFYLTDDYLNGMVTATRSIGFRSGREDEKAFFADILRTGVDRDEVINVCTSPIVQSAIDPGQKLIELLGLTA